jgi:hypothetical protein
MRSAFSRPSSTALRGDGCGGCGGGGCGCCCGVAMAGWLACCSRCYRARVVYKLTRPARCVVVAVAVVAVSAQSLCPPLSPLAPNASPPAGGLGREKRVGWEEEKKDERSEPSPCPSVCACMCVWVLDGWVPCVCAESVSRSNERGTTTGRPAAESMSIASGQAIDRNQLIDRSDCVDWERGGVLRFLV